MTTTERLLKEADEILQMAEDLRFRGRIIEAVTFSLIASQRVQLAKLLDDSDKAGAP